MKKNYILLFILILFSAFIYHASRSVYKNKKTNVLTVSKNETLVVLWTTPDKDVFTKVVFPYVSNSEKYKWWNKEILIIWGPSVKLCAQDKQIQEYISGLKQSGIVLKTCKWCTDQYEVSSVLDSLGIDVEYMGEPLTHYLKSGYKVLTF